MNRVSLSIAVIFLLVIALNLPSWIGSEDKQPAMSKEETFSPDYEAKGMNSTLFDITGEMTHKVFAASMEHYDLLGFTLFNLPEYTIYTSNEDKPWKINAMEGTLYDNNRIQLEKEVEIKSLDENGFIQTISTSFIEIDLNSKTMMSDQMVTITGKDYVINSNGFTADLLTHQFELQNHVQTLFGPSLIH